MRGIAAVVGRAITTALVEAVIAATAVGAIEAGRAIAVGGGGNFATGWVLAALAWAGALPVTLAVGAGGAAAARIPLVRRWLADVAGGGAARALAVWRVALATVAVVGGAVAVDVVVDRAHDAFRFIDGGPVGLLVACAVAPIGLAIVLAALAIDRRVLPRVAARAHLDGRRIWIAAAAGAAIVAFGPALAMRLAAPAVERAVAAIAPLAVVAAAVVRALRLGRRRPAQLAAAVAVVLAILGVKRFADAEHARALAGVHGVFGRAVAQRLWVRADRDRDGYPGPDAGGADCDDADFHTNPGRIEIPNNRIDENCSGADAVVAPAPPLPSATPDAPRRSIVVISVDALRADHLGTYGYARPTSPAIDAFAAGAVKFDRAYTSCPATRCAIPSLLNGRFTSAASEAVGTVATLPGVLAASGYDTAAISCCGRFALGQHELASFQTADISADSVRHVRAGQSNADAVADAAIAWLGTRAPGGRPYVLWLHFYDPHHPYAAPEDPERFGDDDLDRYDAEIAFADRHIGRVLAAIDKDAIVVVTADHGDEFGEHGIRFHARSLFDQVIRIPLVIRVPGVAPATIATPASLVDVFPTLLDLVGLPTPPHLSGRTLAPALRGAPVPHPVLVELVPDATIHRDLMALVDGDRKIIWDRIANAWSMFAVDDVADADDLAGDEAERLADMKRRLLDAIDREIVAK